MRTNQIIINLFKGGVSQVRNATCSTVSVNRTNATSLSRLTLAREIHANHEFRARDTLPVRHLIFSYQRVKNKMQLISLWVFEYVNLYLNSKGGENEPRLRERDTALSALVLLI